MSVQGEVKIPEAYEYDNPLFNLSQGDGQYDTTLLLQFGRGLGKGYAVFNIGYKYRFENDQFDPETFKPSDEFKMTLSGGYAITSWLSLTGSVDWKDSVGNAEVSDEMYEKIFNNRYNCGIKCKKSTYKGYIDARTRFFERNYRASI